MIFWKTVLGYTDQQLEELEANNILMSKEALAGDK